MSSLVSSVISPCGSAQGPTGSIEILYDEKKQSWFKRVHVGMFSCFKCIIISIPEEMKCEQRARGEFEKGCQRFTLLRRSNSQHDVFINFDTVKYILCKSSKPASFTLTKELDMDVLGTKCLQKETDTLSCILKTFHGEEMGVEWTCIFKA